MQREAVLVPENINLLAPGHRLHWYRIDAVLGQGGFGITYLAEDQNLQEKVAIKEYYPPQFATRTEDGSVQQLSAEQTDNYQWGLDRFISEARTLTQFRHPSIVRVRSVFEEHNTAYMVMDFVEGVTLDEKLKGGQALSEAALLALFLPLMEGLEVVHASGFIHRDIKPGNIVVRDNNAVLIDFGAARQALGERSVAMTQIASAGYAPFEQYHSKGDQQGPWTDIYALGATLYRAITGVTPQPAIDRSKALLETSRDIYISISEFCDEDYSAPFLAAIDHALAFRATERPQSVAEWRAELQADNKPQPASEAPTGRVEKGTATWSVKECAAIRQQLQQVLASTPFATAAQLQRLLTYLVDETLAGRGERLNQASIAIDVLGKDADFDAAIDSIVRVEARRLRSRLTEYYYGEGRQDTIHFALPKGRYSMTITFGPESDRTGVAESIKSMSYKIRGASRSKLRRFASTRPLVYSLIGVLIVVLLLVVLNRTVSTDKAKVSTGIAAPTPPVTAARPGSIPGQQSIAVLPFDDWGDESQHHEYISLGLTDDVLTNLSRISGLRVLSRSSSMRYRSTDKTIQQIGHELGVTTILQGSVRHSGNKIKVTVQLIRVADDRNLWANDYVRDIQPGGSEYFEVTGDLARNIARHLNVKILGEENQRIGRVPTDNPQAFDLFSRARLLLTGDRTADEIKQAIDKLERAIALDPGFADAHAALADAYQWLIQVDNRDNDPDLANKSLRHTRLAMELDPELAEPYVTLSISQLFDMDLVGAKQSLETAIKLNYSLADAHIYYGMLLSSVFEHDKAITQARIATRLQPLDAQSWAGGLGFRYVQAGDFDKAIAACQHALELNPDYWVALLVMGEAYSLSGNYVAAIKLLEKAAQVSGNVNDVLADLGYSYGKNGDTARAKAILAKFAAGNVSPVSKAVIYMGLGDKAQALSALETAFLQRDTLIWTLPEFHYHFAPLNKSPRYRALWQKMGLADAWSRMIKQEPSSERDQN